MLGTGGNGGRVLGCVHCSVAHTFGKKVTHTIPVLLILLIVSNYAACESTCTSSQCEKKPQCPNRNLNVRWIDFGECTYIPLKSEETVPQTSMIVPVLHCRALYQPAADERCDVRVRQCA